MDKLEEFAKEVRRNIAGLGEDPDLQALSRIWIREIMRHRYTYNFTWLGRPIIQFPQDVVAVQELIWRTQPDVVIETGIAHGGSLILSASILELLGGDGRVIGVDIDIRAHNRAEVERHRLAKRITMIEGSSTDPAVFDLVRSSVPPGDRVMVILDADHTHDHVLRELDLYSPLVGSGGYIVVFDTVIDDMPADAFPNRSWGPGNNPKTAVHDFLGRNGRFEIDRELENKLLITVAPDGYLRCIAD